MTPDRTTFARLFVALLVLLVGFTALSGTAAADDCSERFNSEDGKNFCQSSAVDLRFDAETDGDVAALAPFTDGVTTEQHCNREFGWGC